MGLGLIPATRNPWDYLEFFFYLKKFNYHGWVTSDMSPMRLDRSKPSKGRLQRPKGSSRSPRMDSEKIYAMIKEEKRLKL